MPDEDWQTPERRAVIAAALDAEKLSARRYRRERIITVTCSLVAALALATVLSFVVSHKLAENAKFNATQNCMVQAGARPTGNGRAFVQRQILRIADRALERFPRRFRDREVARINEELARARELRLLPRAGPERVAGFDDLRVLLEYLPLIDCAETLR